MYGVCLVCVCGVFGVCVCVYVHGHVLNVCICKQAPLLELVHFGIQSLGQSEFA